MLVIGTVVLIIRAAELRADDVALVLWEQRDGRIVWFADLWWQLDRYDGVGDGLADGVVVLVIVVAVASVVAKADLDQDRRLIGAVEEG